MVHGFRHFANRREPRFRTRPAQVRFGTTRQLELLPDGRKPPGMLFAPHFCHTQEPSERGSATSKLSTSFNKYETSSFKLRRWPVNYPPNTACHSLAGAPRIWSSKSSRVVWLRRSAGVRYGAGCTKMPFDPGITAVRYSHATRTSPPKPNACWIYMPASGKARRSSQMSS